ncbi:MAG: ABC transporter ATP-binding protein [Myxococcales bacterium]|nr:ABC transporter ATP-binding protein [Myxococcales bacterium]
MPEVEIRNLKKSYPPPFSWRWLVGKREAPREALAGVSFDIAPGEVVALIGPNGAGKSTLLRILTGLLLPSSGSARVAGLDVVEDRPRSRAVVGAALSEDRGLSSRLTVRQNLAFYAALFGLSQREAASRTAELAERLEAKALLERRVRTLSTGEKARVILVRALLHQPRVLLLDELTRSLDPGAAVRLRRQVAQEVAGSGAAVLFASHDLSEVEAIASRVVLLDRGHVVAFGPYQSVKPRADEVFAKPAEA